MSHFVKSTEVPSVPKCLLSLHLHVDDKLIALRPGHSPSELCLLFSVHLLTHRAARGHGCRYEAAPAQVPNEKHFWISKPLLISMNETLCVDGLSPAPHEQCNCLKLLKMPEDRLIQFTIPASPWDLKKCFTVIHLAKSIDGLYYVL